MEKVIPVVVIHGDQVNVVHLHGQRQVEKFREKLSASEIPPDDFIVSQQLFKTYHHAQSAYEDLRDELLKKEIFR